MNKIDKISSREIPFKVTDPQRIPAKRYYDEDFFKLEAEHLWQKAWQMACRLEEIPEIGDWVEYKILDQSVIVINTKTGIKAFQNACRHRGVQLAMRSRQLQNRRHYLPLPWLALEHGRHQHLRLRQTCLR